MTTTGLDHRIAIVGMGLCYPDASTPDELWANVLAGRQAFRRLPDERMSHADYYSADPAAPDRFYATKAAVLRDYEFDRARHRVAGSTYRATDLTHWLALDVASRALADAGFRDGEGLPRRSTGVVIGNTLTGEFSRASIMRLRWPYVRRTVAAALAERGWEDDETAAFLRDLEPRYKEPFAPVDEDTLAGGLSNTIAGRICNHFDLGGGGFTVDGACSSSLLSVATAAKGLVEGDLDVALAGGVDLSIDPFEVVGFAKTGALATSRMKVYDADANGFWPGEGCGVLVLMRERDAVDQGRRSYASIAGWGVSSDGKGGITRPEASGHRLAIGRAYRRAGYGIDEVTYVEGHGTGTAVGDATEIEALSSARREADPTAPPAFLGTIKGNIGHTKAAAGVAGLIKAVLAVHHQVIPPATGHDRPHPGLGGDRPALVVPDTAAGWPSDRPIRAGVSALGFGGIDTHIAVAQAPGVERRGDLDAHTRSLVAGRQDAELLVFDGDDPADLRARVEVVRRLVPRLSYAELADLGATLTADLAGRPLRAAVVAADPERAERALTRLLDRLDAGEDAAVSAADGVFLGRADTRARIAYFFPGQGSGRPGQGRLARRFPEAVVEPRLDRVGNDITATEVAQPRIVAGSLTALRVLGSLGVEASVAVGHSLGELTALHWAGALDEAEVLRLATVRGRVMATTTGVEGAMAGLGVDAATARQYAEPEGVVIAGHNGPAQTVVSGPTAAVERVCERTRAAGATATRLRVSHAFHSPLVEPAAAALAEKVTEFEFATPRRRVVSTVTGEPLAPQTDLRWLLPEQVRRPVLFQQAAEAAAEADLLVEVGPGRVLTGLLAEVAPRRPALAVDTDSGSLVPLLTVVGAAFALGSPVKPELLFVGRAVRPFSLEKQPSFLTSPCESAPTGDLGASDEPSGLGSVANGSAPEVPLEVPAVTGADGGRDGHGPPNGGEPADVSVGTLDLLRRQAADRVELPVETIGADTHPLDDLHLSSITVAQLVNDVTSGLGLPPLDASTSFATVRLGELAALIDDLADAGSQATGAAVEVAGVAPWVRPFRVEDVPTPAPPAAPRAAHPVSRWQVVAPPGHRLAEPVGTALEVSGLGDGVLLCLPADGGPAELPLLLQAARTALAGAPDSRLVVVQHRLGAAGLGRTLHLESGLPVTVVTLTGLDGTGLDVETAARWVSAEAVATVAYNEVRYSADGTRTVPVLRPLPTAPAAGPRDEARAGRQSRAHAGHRPGAGSGGAVAPLGRGDVLLVTGGGKGITAECALAMARDSGAALALVGRADPVTDPELAENLARMTAAGVRFRYERADVTAGEQVRGAVERFEAELGPVTGVLHGAGRNEPVALGSLTAEQFAAVVAPKVAGLRAVLDAVDTDRLGLLVTFGSIIGRAGLRGEAHYATANDWLTELTVDFGRRHPRARVLALEWSVWSGAGMGERLGVVESLMRTGITPISTDEGIAVLRRVLADPTAGPVLVVSGRTGGLDTLTLASQELPLARFVDRVLVHYPGVELVTETELSAENDPYLADHALDGSLLFPAVLGMEAMAQVARAVGGRDEVPVLAGVEFLRPIAVSPGGTTTLRLAALVRDADTVEVVLLSSETGFGADHFRAVLRYDAAPHAGSRLPEQPAANGGTPAHAPLPPVPVDPAAELYGGVLFQGERFRRLRSYRRAAARHAVAELATTTPLDWFSRFLPQDRVLADPGTRDAVMHALQCCVPDATLLPQRLDRLYLADRSIDDHDVVVMAGRERYREGDSYVYDIDVRTPAGELVERWEGLTLRAVRSRGGAGPWVPSLLGPHLERALEDVLGGERAVVVEPDPAGGGAESTARHRAATALAAGRALDRPVELRYRPDGRPEADGVTVTAAHASGLTLVVTGAGPLACDLEEVVERDQDTWAGILGGAAAPAFDRLLARTGESADLVGTRLWGALECLRKIGTTATVLRVSRVRDDGWIVLSAGDVQLAGWVTTVAGRPNPVVVTVLSGEPVRSAASPSSGQPALQPVGKEN